jgi:septal ring factor EnvC (AmiA/AmiB activator)
VPDSPISTGRGAAAFAVMALISVLTGDLFAPQANAQTRPQPNNSAPSTTKAAKPASTDATAAPTKAPNPPSNAANLSPNASPVSNPVPSEDELKQRAQELEATQQQQRDATEAGRKLQEEVAAISQDRAQLNQQLIDVANRVRDIETKIADTEARLQPLDAKESDLRKSLDSRRGEIIEVLAALQRAGRRTPPALLVRPEDALESLRTAMLLGAVVPDMHARVESLSNDLGELVKVRQAIATEHDTLASERDSMAADQKRLAALVDERQKKQSETQNDLDAEQQRASNLAKQADSLQDLIARMEQELKSAAKVAALANSTVPLPQAPGKPNTSIFKDPSRMAPAIAFASAKGLLPLPVNGTKIRTFGGSDGSGGQEKGISIATRPGAQVTTPCDGWVVYAGPFRTYGQLLILNAGGGYHVLIAGMDRISVNIGQFVLTGEPVATMGASSQVASILATAPSQPVLYIEFRKDGTPIDPSPWWATNEGEKVRG